MNEKVLSVSAFLLGFLSAVVGYSLTDFVGRRKHLRVMTPSSQVDDDKAEFLEKEDHKGSISDLTDGFLDDEDEDE